MLFDVFGVFFLRLSQGFMQRSNIKQFAHGLIGETNTNIRNYTPKKEYFKNFTNNKQ